MKPSSEKKINQSPASGKRDNRRHNLVQLGLTLLIIVLVFVFLTGSAVAAAKINAKIRDTDVSFRYSDAQSEGSTRLRLSGRSGQTGSTSVEVYQENGYRYYVSEDTP